jgi:hypothetical protein
MKSSSPRPEESRVACFIGMMGSAGSPRNLTPNPFPSRKGNRNVWEVLSGKGEPECGSFPGGERNRSGGKRLLGAVRNI